MAEQETRDWADLRIAAIRAVIEVATDFGTKVVAGDPEKLVDAVLAVCDEEAVNRMADRFVDEARIKAIDFRNGVDMDLEPSKTVVAHWVAAAKAWLDSYKAVNYTETEVKLAGEADRFAFILQRVGPGKLTPHEARKAAEAEVERLRAEVAGLREQLEVARG